MIEPAYRYPAQWVTLPRKRPDGDSFYATVDLGFWVSTVIQIRVRGVDAHEMGTPEGTAARDWLIGLLNPEDVPTPLVIESYQQVRSFTRWVCDVWVGERLLADLIVEAGHGVAIR